ncbi:hypothetical protein H0H87_010285, partial [Tephrocybe sp. NHM501043]
LSGQHGSQALVLADELDDKSDDSSQEYLPLPAPSEDKEGSSSSNEPESEDAIGQKPGSKQGQKQELHHNDISALRATDAVLAMATSGKCKAEYVVLLTPDTAL